MNTKITALTNNKFAKVGNIFRYILTFDTREHTAIV